MQASKHVCAICSTHLVSNDRLSPIWDAKDKAMRILESTRRLQNISKSQWSVSVYLGKPWDSPVSCVPKFEDREWEGWSKQLKGNYWKAKTSIRAESSTEKPFESSHNQIIENSDELPVSPHKGLVVRLWHRDIFMENRFAPRTQVEKSSLQESVSTSGLRKISRWSELTLGKITTTWSGHYATWMLWWLVTICTPTYSRALTV